VLRGVLDYSEERVAELVKAGVIALGDAAGSA
jgi:hypothetical protein